MKKKLAVLFAILALCVLGTAAADENPFLGKPLPDFRTMDTERNVFCLSEALQDHDAVLINLWTSWCHPCKMEYPYLNEAYEKYGDRVAFIGMTIDSEDTWDILREMKEEYAMAYPVARESVTGILNYLGGRMGTPNTIIVDRFGNIVYIQVGAFADSNQLSRVLDVFLAEDYTASVPLAHIPLSSETQALPVSSARRIWVENEDARRVLLTLRYYDDEELTKCWLEEVEEGWVIDGDTARLRMELAAGDDLRDMVFTDFINDAWDLNVYTLLDPEQGNYYYEMPLKRVPDKSGWFTAFLEAKTKSYIDSNPQFLEKYLFPDEDAIREMVEELREDKIVVTWEYAEEEDPPTAEQPDTGAYTLDVIDQYNRPVPSVMVSFCTDVACQAETSDENGVVTFTGEPADYHVQVLRVPKGYSFDPDFELRTGTAFGEWNLVIRKD